MARFQREGKLNCDVVFLLHLDFDLSIGPAAHEAATSFSRPIVSYDVENVITRFAEGCGRDGLAVENRIRGRGELRFLNRGTLTREGHLAGSAKLIPQKRYGWRPRLSCTWRDAGIISHPQREFQGLPDIGGKG